MEQRRVGCQHKALDTGDAEQVQGGHGRSMWDDSLQVHQCRNGSGKNA